MLRIRIKILIIIVISLIFAGNGNHQYAHIDAIDQIQSLEEITEKHSGVSMQKN